MFHKSLTLVVRNLSLILRLNIPPNSKYLLLHVLEVPYNSDLSTNFLEFYAFGLQIATFSFFTSLLDSVLLWLLEVTNIISSGFPLIRFAHVFLVLNSSLSFLKMEDPNQHPPEASRLWALFQAHTGKTISHHATGQKQLKHKSKYFSQSGFSAPVPAANLTYWVCFVAQTTNNFQRKTTELGRSTEIPSHSFSFYQFLHFFNIRILCVLTLCSFSETLDFLNFAATKTAY